MTPRELDLHVHAGLERVETLEQVLDFARADGRAVCGLVDHAELYRRRLPGWAEDSLHASPALPDKAALFKRRLKGPHVFYESAREAIARHDGPVKHNGGVGERLGLHAAIACGGWRSASASALICVSPSTPPGR